MSTLTVFSHDNPCYFVSLPNPGTDGNPKFLRNGDPALIQRWIEAEDRPGFGVYHCPNQIKREATRHGRDSTAAIRVLFVDVDLKNIVETPEAAEQKLLHEVWLPPTWIVKSGHGFHVGWELKEQIACDEPEFEDACGLQEALIEYLGGDQSVRPWSLLRLPGTTNTKSEPHVRCEEMHRGAPIDISEIRELLEIVGSARLLTRKPAVEAPVTERAAPGAKVDADGELAAMAPGQVNATHMRVIPSLLQREHPDDVLNAVVNATMEMAAARGLDWLHAVEVRAVRSKILSAYNNLLLKDYDPSTGVIPAWLPGEYHAAFIERIQAGHRPVFGFNRGGFYVKNEMGANGATTVSIDGAPFEDVAEVVTPSPVKRFSLRRFARIDEATLPPRQWLYGQYQRGTVSATIAPGGSGKTTLGMVEAVAMATARNLLGEQPEARLRVWLHNGEDTLEELNRRLVAICKHYKIPQEELEGWFFMTSGNEVPLRVANGYSDLKIDQVLIKCIEGEIADNGIDIVLLDPLITLHGVSEQDNGKMDAVIRIFARIADNQECAIGLAHHTRKQAPGANGADYGADDMRGASATRDAVRAARMLNHMGSKEAGEVGIQEHERTSYFRVDRVKANNAPPDKAVWRRFVNVELLNGDHVGVVVPWLYPGQDSPSPEMSAAYALADDVFMRLLVRLTLNGRTVSDRAGMNYAPTLFCREAEAKAAKVGKKPLADAMLRLLKAGRIRAEDSGEGGHRRHWLAVA